MVDKAKELLDLTKSGDEKCGRLAHDLNHYKQKARKRREDIEKSKEALKIALFDKKEQVAINLRQKKLMDDAQVAATETENRLKKEIETLRKSVSSVSKIAEKPVDSTPLRSDRYAPPRVHAPPKIHIVKDDNDLKLDRLVKTFQIMEQIRVRRADVWEKLLH